MPGYQLPVVVPYLLLVSRLWLSIGTSVSCHLHQKIPIFLATMVYELPSLLLKDTLNKTMQVVCVNKENPLEYNIELTTRAHQHYSHWVKSCSCCFLPEKVFIPEEAGTWYIPKHGTSTHYWGKSNFRSQRHWTSAFTPPRPCLDTKHCTLHSAVTSYSVQCVWTLLFLLILPTCVWTLLILLLPLLGLPARVWITASCKTHFPSQGSEDHLQVHPNYLLW